MARPRVTQADPLVPRFIARGNAVEAFEAWRAWLADERRCSPHTISAYSQDLTAFFAFLGTHLEAPAALEDLAALRAADFRGWLAQRRTAGMTAPSNARALSVLRGFFRFLARRDLVHNAQIATMRSPKLPRSLPKPLTVVDAAHVVEDIDSLSEEPWI